MTGGKKPRSVGKSFEAGVAKRIGGKRAGYGNASSEPDITSDWLDVEAKVMPLPAKLESALRTVKSRSKGGKLCAVVLKEKGKSWSEARIYLSFLDYCDYYGND